MPPRPQDFNNLYLIASHGFCSARGYHANEDKKLLAIINQSVRFDSWAKAALFAVDENGDVHLCPELCNDVDAREDIWRVMGRLGNEMNKYGENLVQMRAAAQRAELERREQEHRRREQQHQRQQGRPGPSEQDNQHGQSGQSRENGQDANKKGSWTPPPTPQDRQDQNRLEQHGQRHPPPGNGEDGQATANSGTPNPATLQAVSEEEDTLYRAIERTIDKLYDICPVGLLSHDEDNDVSMHDGDVIIGNAGMNGNGSIGGVNGASGGHVENQEGL